MSGLVGVRVLVVDDDDGVREAVHDYLVDCSADVVSVSSAAAAMRVMTTAPPAVVVSDISMPEHDGFWLIRAIRALGPPQGGVPVVAVTGRLDLMDSLLEAGFSEVRGKPLDMGEIVELLARLVGRG